MGPPIIFLCSDGVCVLVSQEVAQRIPYVSAILDDPFVTTERTIQLHGVDSQVFTRITQVIDNDEFRVATTQELISLAKACNYLGCAGPLEECLKSLDDEKKF